ncbi:MAG: mannose-6-phosphate isomerase, class I [Actinomycetota bacterium]
MDLLEGSVQSYAWGDVEAIPALQGREPSGEPEAELWLGAHPVAPSRLAGDDRRLDEMVEAAPANVLGDAVNERFGRFPYLLKVLAAAEPLSIQVHPSLVEAKAGFAREEADGIDRGDPARTYRDDNHKPELICALTPFEAKCGFRVPAVTSALVASLATRPPAGEWLTAFADVLAGDDGAGDGDRVAATLAWLFALDGEEAAALVAELLPAADDLLAEIRTDETLMTYAPELEQLAKLDRFHPGDIGVAVSLLLNHVILAPGQAMFLDAGNMHAYLRGTGVELMANSDNVIRGGLTVKHVDVGELLRVVDTTSGPAPVQTAGDGVHHFDTPVPEFGMSRIVGPATVDAEPVGPEIVLVTDGEVSMARDDEVLAVLRGSAAFVAADDGGYRIEVPDGATAWRATVGDLSLS